MGQAGIRTVLVCFSMAGLLAPAAPAAADTAIWGAQGLAVSVNPSGTYDIRLQNPSWDFGGSIGAPLSNLAIATGTDIVGDYSEISFDFQTDAPRHAAIRAYQNHQTVLFTLTAPGGAPNTLAFPNLTRYPSGLKHLGFAGSFANFTFSNLPPESPWMFFDAGANAFIVSAAANFMVAQTNSGANGSIAAGIAPAITSLPQGFTHQVLLVVDSGINQTFSTWGQALTGLHGKKRPPNDADISLNRLGYWTDNGASYYYHMAGASAMSSLVSAYGPANPYEQTLMAVKANFDFLGISLGTVQLDSWFYPKGAGSDWSDGTDGIYQYLAAPTLFTAGLAAFQQNLSVPLITHARWIDASSPYRQTYQISGNVAIDPLYWNDIASYLKRSGVTVFEQDWLSAQAQTAFNLNDPDAFLDNMASGMARQGIDMQYCMATPRHFLQTSKYDNLTSIRVSADRFESSKWSAFLYASRLAGALGVWPFSDVFMSSETGNLLLATLSAGPVGVGDPLGSLNAPNLLRAVRPDGVIVKPDVPATPLDGSFLNDSQGAGAPMIASTYSDFGDLRTYYLFAYPEGPNTDAHFALSDIGAAGPVYLYDYMAGTGRIVNGSDVVDVPITSTFLYLVAAPVGASGMAILGDTGHFVTMGKKRVTAMMDDGTVQMTVAFAQGETSRTIQGYSPNAPQAAAAHGLAGPVTYNAATQRFAVAVSPGPDGTATIALRRAPLRTHLPR